MNGEASPASAHPGPDVVRQHLHGSDGVTREALVLTANEPFPVEMTVVPDAGMVGASLRVDGHEFLGQRRGLDAYVSDAKTFGIPLLAPWANRLGSGQYEVGGTTVDVSGVPGVHADAAGLPIHGLLSAAQGWHVSAAGTQDPRESPGATALIAEAVLDFDDRRPEFPAFPFPHRIEVRYRLLIADPGTVAAQGWQVRLEVRTSIEPTGPSAVPIAFGWHPYFQIPWVPREQWELIAPLNQHVVLDDRCIPTGEVRVEAVPAGPLGDRTYDDLYADVPPGTRVHVRFNADPADGPSGSLTVEYTDGYPYAVLYAPSSDPLIAIEPMTAPTDPFGGTFAVREVVPGETFTATWAVEVDLHDAQAAG